MHRSGEVRAYSNERSPVAAGDFGRYPSGICQMNTQQFVFAILILVIPSSASAQPASLTPAWAEDNPGRLTMSSGAAFGGWNGYTFKLHFDSLKHFSVRSTVLLRRDDEKNNLQLHSFKWSIDKPSRVLQIELTTPSFTPPKKSDMKIIEQADAVVSITVHHLNDDGKQNGKTDEYELTLSDFRGISLLPQNGKQAANDNLKGG